MVGESAAEGGAPAAGVKGVKGHASRLCARWRRAPRARCALGDCAHTPPRAPPPSPSPPFPQILVLLWLLLVAIPRPSAILVQNPPSLPTLAVVWLACRLRGARMVIDWHNFGYTVLGLTRGRRDPLVRFSRAYEAFFAARADGHLCVTAAMRICLAEYWCVT